MPLSPYHLELQPLDDQRSGTPFEARNVREYKKRFRIVMVSKEFDAIAVCACPGLPYPYSSYYSASFETGTLVYDLYALMIKMTAETDQDEFTWIVTCEYSTQMPDGGKASFPGYPATVGNRTGGGAANNPELEPPSISWEGEIVQEAPATDLDGKPFTNSSGQPFSPPPTFPVGYAMLVYSRNELNFNMDKAVSYSFAVNKTKFLGAAPGAVQIQPITGQLTHRGPLAFVRVSYRFKFHRKYLNDEGKEVYDSWQPAILDSGTCRLQKDNTKPNFGKPIPIIRWHQIVSQPVLLDGNGQELDVDNANGDNPLNIKAVYRNFRQYQEKDFNQLLITGVG